MGYAYISFSPANKRFAQNLVDDLADEFSLAYDQPRLRGEAFTWQDQQTAISRASVIIWLITPESFSEGDPALAELDYIHTLRPARKLVVLMVASVPTTFLPVPLLPYRNAVYDFTSLPYDMALNRVRQALSDVRVTAATESLSRNRDNSEKVPQPQVTSRTTPQGTNRQPAATRQPPPPAPKASVIKPTPKTPTRTVPPSFPAKSSASNAPPQPGPVAFGVSAVRRAQKPTNKPNTGSIGQFLQILVVIMFVLVVSQVFRMVGSNELPTPTATLRVALATRSLRTTPTTDLGQVIVATLNQRSTATARARTLRAPTLRVTSATSAAIIVQDGTVISITVEDGSSEGPICTLIITRTTRAVLNVRASAESPTVATIPLGTIVTASGLDSAEAWYYVTYGKATGWLRATQAEILTPCGKLPIRATSIPSPTVQATARATAQATATISPFDRAKTLAAPKP